MAGGWLERLEHLDPELADLARDARALIRCALAEDDEAARVMLRVLEDEPGRTAKVAHLLAELCAELVRCAGPEWLDGSREL